MFSADLPSVAAKLIDAIEHRHRLPGLGDALPPGDLVTAYAIQALVAEGLGPVAAFKCGAPSAVAEPMGAAIPAACLASDGAALAGLMVPLVEVEVAFTMARDLPPRDRPYTRTELLAALGPARPALELVESRLEGFPSCDLAWQIADLQNHGRLVLGAENPDWLTEAGADIDINAFLDIGGEVQEPRLNANSAGDLFRPFLWLLNEGPARRRGLRRGDVVTTGSCSGSLPIRPGQSVIGTITGLGSVRAQLI